jgi:hypothetical protein
MRLGFGRRYSNPKESRPHAIHPHFFRTLLRLRGPASSLGFRVKTLSSIAATGRYSSFISARERVSLLVAGSK